MSYCGAFPSAESESHILIDTCLARVREDAGLDNDPVLPPLHVLIGKPGPATPKQIRFVVGASAHDLPTAEAIVRAAVGTGKVDITNKPSDDNDASGRARALTCKTHKSTAKAFLHHMRWPVFLCGFLAGTFGGIALMKSPVGEKPGVQRVVRTARSHAASAYAATSRVVR